MTALARVIWWLLFVPRLVAGITAAMIVWSLPGENLSGWWFLAGIAAFWIVSPFRLRKIVGRRRLRRREVRWMAQPYEWKPGPAVHHSA